MARSWGKVEVECVSLGLGNALEVEVDGCGCMVYSAGYKG